MRWFTKHQNGCEQGTSSHFRVSFEDSKQKLKRFLGFFSIFFFMIFLKIFGIFETFFGDFWDFFEIFSRIFKNLLEKCGKHFFELFTPRSGLLNVGIAGTSGPGKQTDLGGRSVYFRHIPIHLWGEICNLFLLWYGEAKYIL